jgi:hypothetical protein
MPSKARLLAKSMIESPILSEITTNPTVTPTTITTAVNDVATGNFASIDLLPSTGNDVGDQAFVQATNRLYIWSGAGWYNIALINTTPTWDSNGQPNSSYILDADSPQTATTITLAASDPEGFPITYSHVTGGSMDSIATINQDSSVFTITPKTEVQAPDGGTGTITFRASDGVNILPQVSSFSLSFVTDVDVDVDNVTYDNVSLSVGNIDTDINDLAFNNDGTKLIMLGRSTDTVYQYSLSTAYDLSTASIDTSVFSVTNQESSPRAFVFNNNGSKMYVVGSASDAVFQYSLSTNFDITTASYDNVSFDVSNQETSPYAVIFNNDGTKMYIGGFGTSTVYQYSLSTAFDITTASYNSVSLSPSNQGNIEGLSFNQDGTKLYFVGSNDTVYQYSLSTAYDISTGSYSNLSFSLTSQLSDATGIVFSDSYDKMYISCGSQDAIFQYSTE